MTTGSNTYKGLAVPLQGESQIRQLVGTTDLLTLTSASTGQATGQGYLFCIEDSAGVEMFRYLSYGRLRLIRTDTAQQHTYINALDVKMDLDYAAGGAQCYAATFILDTAGGSTGGGREAVLHLQYYGHAGVSNGQAYSFINFSDQGSLGEVGALFVVLRQAGTAGGCFEEHSGGVATHGFVIYVDNVKYWLLACDSS